MEEDIKKTFSELRSAVSKALDRAVTYEATEPLEDTVQEVISALGKASALISQVQIPPTPESLLLLELEQLRSELSVQDTLLTLCSKEV